MLVRKRIPPTRPLEVRLVPLALAALCTPAVSACSSGSSSPAQSAEAVDSERSQTVSRLDEAARIVEQFRPELPDTVMNRARCLMIIPDLKKGGLIVGAQGGKGFATCRWHDGWSAPAPITMGGGTLGAQVGFQSSNVLAVLMSETAIRALESDNLKVGADVSAAAGPVGKERSATTDVGIQTDMVSYSQASGLFAGATLNGMKVGEDRDATRALYGSHLRLSQVLRSRPVLLPDPAAARFDSAVRQTFGPPTVGLAY